MVKFVATRQRVKNLKKITSVIHYNITDVLPFFVIFQQQSHYQSIVNFLKNLFYFAHPKTRISTELFVKEESQIFISPFEGYLR